jgi:hypothetical protein
MGWMISRKKLRAATRSMHQFCPVVRTIFRAAVADDVIEATTVYLYERTAHDVFGGRFAAVLRAQLRSDFRYGSTDVIENRLSRINHNVEEFRRAEEEWAGGRGSQDEYTKHVRSAIRAILAEAGLDYDDPELVKDTFPRFEDAARRLQEHLRGIKQQSSYMMR